MQKKQPPTTLGFAASSGTGKTTLLTQLIPFLKQQGIKVGLIKHSHHDFDMDQPGKDSYCLRKAGADTVLLVSAYRRAIITEIDSIEPTLNEQIELLSSHHFDIILVEGFKHEAFPKIELHRKELKQPLLYPHDENIIAVASNDSLETQLPLLDINKPEQIAEFIIERVLHS